ncbi:cyclic nucleotide-binding domain-containing protein, partial [Haematococcus lacustris]
MQMRDAFDKVIATNPVPYFIFAAGLVIGGLFASYDCGRFLTSLAGQAFGAATFLCAQAVDQALVGGAILASDAVAQ